MLCNCPRSERSMAITLHRGRSPLGTGFRRYRRASIPRRWVSIPIATGCASFSFRGGDGDAHLVHFRAGPVQGTELTRLLADPSVVKLFHYAALTSPSSSSFGVIGEPIWCTKIASKLTRTYTDRHGLKDLCQELLDIEISKQQQSSDWGATPQRGAACLCSLRRPPSARAKGFPAVCLAREGRTELAAACFRYLPSAPGSTSIGWAEEEIFAH